MRAGPSSDAAVVLALREEDDVERVVGRAAVVRRGGRAGGAGRRAAGPQVDRARALDHRRGQDEAVQADEREAAARRGRRGQRAGPAAPHVGGRRGDAAQLRAEPPPLGAARGLRSPRHGLRVAQQSPRGRAERAGPRGRRRASGRTGWAGAPCTQPHAGSGPTGTIFCGAAAAGETGTSTATDAMATTVDRRCDVRVTARPYAASSARDNRRTVLALTQVEGSHCGRRSPRGANVSGHADITAGPAPAAAAASPPRWWSRSSR